MKKLKILQIKVVKLICIIVLMSFSYVCNAQLPGLGVEFNSGVNINSLAINSFGLDASHEMGGAYLSVKNLVGAKRGILIIENESVSNTIKTNLIRHQLQVKYWFGNMIRARKIHPLRCAHLIKITEDYHFKPYLLMGVDNGLDLKRNNSNRYQLNGVFGLGANIRKFGNIYSARLLFVELRSYTQINSSDSFSRIGFEGAVGIKFY